MSKKKLTKDTSIRVLCAVCSQYFDTPQCCLECSNWNVCLPCLAKEGEETAKVLAARGITLPSAVRR
mgnify:CR=1 FL=1